MAVVDVFSLACGRFCRTLIKLVSVLYCLAIVYVDFHSGPGSLSAQVLMFTRLNNNTFVKCFKDKRSAEIGSHQSERFDYFAEKVQTEKKNTLQSHSNEVRLQ